MKKRKSCFTILLLLMCVMLIPAQASAKKKKKTGQWENVTETYYVKPDGSLAVGAYVINGVECMFDEEGRLVSPTEPVLPEEGARWKHSKARYYIKKNGKRATGSVKIGTRYYVFDNVGRLIRPKKLSFVTLGKSIYYVSSKGRAVSGWRIIKKKLYYIEENGKVKRNTTYRGITLTKKTGAAKMDTNALAKIKAMEIVDSITNSRMSQSQKLRACWSYVAGGRFYYAMKYPNLNASGWQRATAYNMFTTRGGNCYSFACAFAALAAEVGYEPYVVCGRVSGSRDGAGDGLTRHAWVRINGLNYDPEAQYAGWMRGIYGSGGYPVRHTIQRIVKYW